MKARAWREAMGRDQMIIDLQLPAYDVVLAVHKIVDADLATTFAAARDLDFLTVRTPLLDTAMWLRGLPDRLRHRTAPPLAHAAAACSIRVATASGCDARSARPLPAAPPTAAASPTGCAGPRLDLIVSDPRYSRWFVHAYAGVDDQE
jgi:hypothetical protein